MGGQGVEAGRLLREKEVKRAGRPVAVLGDKDVRKPLGILTGGVTSLPLFLAEISVIPVDEEHHIGILLNAPALTQVGQLRYVGLARLHCAAELGEGQHRHMELPGQGLEGPGDLAHLLHPVVLKATARDELDIVHYHQVESASTMRSDSTW